MRHDINLLVPIYIVTYLDGNIIEQIFTSTENGIKHI